MPWCICGGQRIIFRTLVSPFTMGAGDQTQASKFATANSLPTEPYRWLLMFFFLFFFKEFFMHVCVPV